MDITSQNYSRYRKKSHRLSAGFCNRITFEDFIKKQVAER